MRRFGRNIRFLNQPHWDAGTDARRVRTLTVKVLEDASNAGNTLMPTGSKLFFAIRNLEIKTWM